MFRKPRQVFTKHLMFTISFENYGPKEKFVSNFGFYGVNFLFSEKTSKEAFFFLLSKAKEASSPGYSSTLVLLHVSVKMREKNKFLISFYIRPRHNTLFIWYCQVLLLPISVKQSLGSNFFLYCGTFHIKFEERW